MLKFTFTAVVYKHWAPNSFN